MWHLTPRYRFYFLNCPYKGLIAHATRNTGGPPPTAANPAKFLSGRRKKTKNKKQKRKPLSKTLPAGKPVLQETYPPVSQGGRSAQAPPPP